MLRALGTACLTYLGVRLDRDHLGHGDLLDRDRLGHGDLLDRDRLGHGDLPASEERAHIVLLLPLLQFFPLRRLPRLVRCDRDLLGRCDQLRVLLPLDDAWSVVGLGERLRSLFTVILLKHSSWAVWCSSGRKLF